MSPVIDETQHTRQDKSKNKKKRKNYASSTVLNERREKQSKGHAKNSTEEKAPQLKKKNYKRKPEKVTNDVKLKVADQKEEKEINKQENITKMKRINECVFSNFALTRCESTPTKIICAFCRSADVTEVSFYCIF